MRRTVHRERPIARFAIAAALAGACGVPAPAVEPPSDVVPPARHVVAATWDAGLGFRAWMGEFVDGEPVGGEWLSFDSGGFPWPEHWFLDRRSLRLGACCGVYDSIGGYGFQLVERRLEDHAFRPLGYAGLGAFVWGADGTAVHLAKRDGKALLQIFAPGPEAVTTPVAVGEEGGYGGDLHVSPDGRRLLASSEGLGWAAVFERKADGRLEEMHRTAAGSAPFLAGRVASGDRLALVHRAEAGRTEITWLDWSDPAMPTLASASLDGVVLAAMVAPNDRLGLVRVAQPPDLADERWIVFSPDGALAELDELPVQGEATLIALGEVVRVVFSDRVPGESGPLLRWVDIGADGVAIDAGSWELPAPPADGERLRELRSVGAVRTGPDPWGLRDH